MDQGSNLTYVEHHWEQKQYNQPHNSLEDM